MTGRSVARPLGYLSVKGANRLAALLLDCAFADQLYPKQALKSHFL